MTTSGRGPGPAGALWALGLALLLAWRCPAAGPPLSAPPPLLNDAAAGQSLAAELRATKPAAATELRGQLRLRNRDGAQALSLVSRIVPGTNSWQAVYHAASTNWTEKLVVVRAAGSPNEYRHLRQDGPGEPPPLPPPATNIWQRFAGSDFCLADLGLDFLHWPKQVLVMNEMRKNRACHVLDSLPEAGAEYSRVRSWIDVENGGVLMAEAYGHNGRRIKEFEVRRLSKVGDQWQLQEIEMRRLPENSRTTIVFDTDAK